MSDGLKSNTSPPLIGVIGSSEANAEETSAAEAVGRALAKAGAWLICGGRGGIMEAACRGAKSADGLTIGILSGIDPAQANRYVDIPIVTGLGEARNAIIARTAQALIAIGGSYGTLSEIAFALSFGKMVVGLNTWHVKRAGLPQAPIVYVETPEQAVKHVVQSAKIKFPPKSSTQSSTQQQSRTGYYKTLENEFLTPAKPKK